MNLPLLDENMSDTPISVNFSFSFSSYSILNFGTVNWKNAGRNLVPIFFKSIVSMSKSSISYFLKK